MVPHSAGNSVKIGHNIHVLDRDNFRRQDFGKDKRTTIDVGFIQIYPL
jgi:hypothetical protein